MKTDRIRGKRGSVHIESNSRLRWTVNGKKYRLTVKPSFEMQAKAHIERDILNGIFDNSLDSYKDAYSVKKKELMNPSLVIAHFMQLRKGEVKQKTYDDTYAVVAAQLLPCCHLDVSDAENVYKWIIKTHSPNTARRILMTLNAACNRVLGESPYEGFYKRVRVDSQHKVRVLTKEEKDSLLAAIRSEKSLVYYRFTEFLFLTGCRPGEAVALRWGDVLFGYHIHFERNATESRGKIVESNTTKTGSDRYFPMTHGLEKCLRALRVPNLTEDDLVFRIDGLGGYLRLSNYRSRCWNVYAPEDTTPYNARDTFITSQILAGVPTAQVALWCGNSVSTIERHYLSRTQLGSIKPVE